MGIKVLVIDDSATARAILTNILNQAPFIESVDSAPDAYIGRDKIVKSKPDVVCLDVEMPRMDGITFLRKLMKYMPIPVLMVSSLTKKGSQVTMDALESGAVDFIEKPHSNIYDSTNELQKELLDKVEAVAKAKLQKRINISSIKKEKYTALAETTNKVIAIGASTGGTEAIKEVLLRMPRNAPGIVIVQHMPGTFTPSFAKRLNEICEIEVKEANNGDTIGIGQALIAPGNYHMVVRRSGARYYVELGGGINISGHKPSVDVLFKSISNSVGANAIGIILTGMGADGAKGMFYMHNAGAKTIAQDEETCVVFGMPKVAISKGCVDEILPLHKITQRILKLL
jgi:two-component system chemotaxis response regulator CheB